MDIWGDSYWVVWFAIGFIALIGIIVSNVKPRQGELEKLAANYSFAFSKTDPLNIPQRYAGFIVLNQAERGHAYNVMHGTHNHHPVKAFDYNYKVAYRVYDLSAVILDIDGNFKSVLIYPKYLDFADIFPANALEPVHFESAKFNKAFYVYAENQRSAYDVVTPHIMEFLLKRDDWAIQLHQSAVIVTRDKDVTFSPEEFSDAIKFAEAFLKLLPPYVWEKGSGASS
ncbi:MAG TPA: DUF3137 domain-containing protein [Xanthobacteraceae bacterium]|nr:DUF3137 domain-containing protein [Xanthobacteraceae bacterium]